MGAEGAGRAGRALARAAGRADRDPRVKGLVEAPEGLRPGAPRAGESPVAGPLREFLGSSRWYVPGVPGPRSARAAVWETWARARVQGSAEGWDLDHAFVALRVLNAAAERARHLDLPRLPSVAAGVESKGAAGGGVAARPSGQQETGKGGKVKRKGHAKARGQAKEAERRARGRVAAVPAPQPGTLLVAHPRLGGYFCQAVVLLVGHDEGGSYGVVVNKVFPGLERGPPGRVGATSQADLSGREKLPFSPRFKPDLNFYLEAMEAQARESRPHFSRKSDGEDCEDEEGEDEGPTLEVEIEEEGGEGEGRGELDGLKFVMGAGVLGGDAFPKLFEELDSMEEQLAGIHEDFRRQRVYSGGPVPGFQVLHQMPDIIQGGTEVPVGGDGAPLYVGGECELSEPLKGVSESGAHPKFRLFVGESTWVPGQLQTEIDEGSWIVAKVDGALDYMQLLQGAPDSEGDEKDSESERRLQGLWHTIMEDLGGEYSAMASLPAQEDGEDDMEDAFPMLFFNDGARN